MISHRDTIYFAFHPYRRFSPQVRVPLNTARLYIIYTIPSFSDGFCSIGCTEYERI
jgi:hypothetical protein